MALIEMVVSMCFILQRILNVLIGSLAIFKSIQLREISVSLWLAQYMKMFKTEQKKSCLFFGHLKEGHLKNVIKALDEDVEYFERYNDP